MQYAALMFILVCVIFSDFLCPLHLYLTAKSMCHVYVRTLLLLVITIVALSGCMPAQTVATSGTLSDAVYFAADPVSLTVDYVYSTATPDDSIRAVFYKKNGEQQRTANLDVRHNGALEQMFGEYLTSTFSGPGSDVEVELRLNQVELRSESLDSGGQQFATALVGGELRSVKRARQRALLTVRTGGETYEKTLVGSASTEDVDGIGTGTETSNVYRGQDSDEAIYGRLLSDSSNKLILQAAQFIRSLEL